MRLGRLEITASGWPWQDNLARSAFGRFGGGWNWKLGFMAGGKTIVFDLLFGSIRFAWKNKT